MYTPSPHAVSTDEPDAPVTLDKEIVRARNDLAEVIEALTGHAPRQRGGTRERWVLCPFHDDHEPSLRINEEKQCYYCDPCGFGGDVFDFVMRSNRCDF